MAKKTKSKKVKKAKKTNHSPTLSAADRNWLVELMVKAQMGRPEMMLKKEPRSQKRRGQVTGGDR